MSAKPVRWMMTATGQPLVPMEFDIGTPGPDEVVVEIAGCGVCHQLIPEKGHVTCGDLVLGADSHTCTYGAINVLSTGVGSTDLAITLASGKNWFRVPDSMRVTVKGRLPKGVYSKDIILHIIKDIGSNGATYRSVEFYGDAISGLSVDGRFTISNMAVEMGAKAGVMEADDKALEWVGERQGRPHPGDPRPDDKRGRGRLDPEVRQRHAQCVIIINTGHW